MKLNTSTAFFLSLIAAAAPVVVLAAAATRPPRPPVPARDPHGPGYVEAKELPDGDIPPADADGNFIIGPTHKKAPEFTPGADVPKGTVHEVTIKSTDSKIYPGIAREQGTFGTPDPKDPTNLIVTTSHPAPWTRKVSVYVPKQYPAGTASPFIVTADGDKSIFPVLDSLIAAKRVPA